LRLFKPPDPGAPQKEGLVVKDVVVLIDREQGGEAHLAANGLKLHAAFKLSAMLDVLQKHGHVSDDVAAKVRKFIADNQTKRPEAAAAAAPAPAPAAAKPQRCVCLRGARPGAVGRGRDGADAPGGAPPWLQPPFPLGDAPPPETLAAPGNPPLPAAPPPPPFPPPNEGCRTRRARPRRRARWAAPALS
jgi:hypothetical protein